jgi:hypothetical protein
VRVGVVVKIDPLGGLRSVGACGTGVTVPPAGTVEGTGSVTPSAKPLAEAAASDACGGESGPVGLKTRQRTIPLIARNPQRRPPMSHPLT